MFEMSMDKLLLLGFLGVMLIGPTRLPAVAAQLGRFVRSVRQYADTATVRMQQELGTEIDVAELKKLDPRQYDPRSIIRAALDDAPQSAKTPGLERNDATHA